MVVDASVILAVILNEPEKSGIIAATQGGLLLAPGCLSWEVGNAFSAMLKTRRLRVEEALAGLDIFERIPVRESAVDLKAALKLSHKHQIYAYDAYYVEVARRGNLPLLTLDRKMAEVAGKEAVELKRIP